MTQNDIEMLIASAINRANGTYRAPTFGADNTAYVSGYYRSIHGESSGGRYAEQQWSGSAGVVMTGDPIITSGGRNDISGGIGSDVIYAGKAGYAVVQGGAGDDSLFGGRNSVDAKGGTGNDFIVAGMDVLPLADGNFLSAWKNIFAGAGSMSADELHNKFWYSNSHNTLYGGDGNDTLIAAGNGNNVMYGDDTSSASGNDLMIAGNGNNTMYGGAGSDSIFTGSGVNTIEGGAGNDYIEVAGGADSTIRGGSGDDTLVVNGTHQYVFGEEDNDRISGVMNDSWVYAGDGSDTIYASGTKNNINGDNGNDLIHFEGGEGGNSIYGGSGNDTISMVASNNMISGDFGDDFIYVEGNKNMISGGPGNDTISIKGSNNNVFGSLTTEISVAGDNNTINGGSGTDTIHVDGNLNSIKAGDGSDTIHVGNLNSVDTTNNTISGGNGDDIVFVNGSNNKVMGDAGNDTFYLANDANSIDGGEGIDVISFAQNDAGVTIGSRFWESVTSVEGVIGSALADTITGSAGDNYIDGGGGLDSLDGGAGNDTLGFTGVSQGVYVNLQDRVAQLADSTSLGTIANFEAVTGSAFNDTLVGDSGDNHIDGGAGNDSLVGGAGNDTLNGGAGSNTLDGGEGFDLVDYSSSSSALNVNFATGEITGGQNDSLVSIEGFIGSAYNDTFTGGAGVSHFAGGKGNDLFVSGTGADTLDGGEGIDTVSYANSDAAVLVDMVNGGQGGSAAGDAYSGIEVAIGSAHNDTLIGDSGNNMLLGEDGADSLSGGSGNDTLIGGADSDTLDGGDGIDVLSYAGSDAGISVDLSTNTGHGGHAEGDIFSNVEQVIGSDFDDTLAGSNTAATTLDGGAGNDMFAASQFGTSFVGGAGIDTVSYALSDAAVQVDLAAGTAEGGWAQGDVYNGIEAVVGSQFDDIIAGRASGSTLSGGAGNDTLRSGSGADSLDGGEGFDIADYSNANTTLSIDLRTGVGGGYATGDTLVSIEGLIGGNSNDVLHGGNGASFIDGGAGIDYIYGHGSGSTLRGGAGNDSISAEGVDNLIDGGEGRDSLNYASASSGLNINLQTGRVQHGDAGNDTLLGIEYLTASEFDDTITGSLSDSDTILSGTGNDSIVASAAANRISGDAGIDTVDYSQSDAAVKISMQGGVGSGGFAQGDILSSVEVLIGSQYGDSLDGSANADTIFGGAGNDTINGAGSADLIDGGVGDDMVIYANSSYAVTVNLSTGAASGGDAHRDTLVSIENVTGSNYNDTIVGSDGANRLVGGYGNDSLVGGAGDDTLEGGDGADLLDGGTGMNFVDYSSSNGNLNINLSTGKAYGGHATGDTLISINGVIGSMYGDYFTAGPNAASIDGGLGIDSLSFALSTAGVNVDLATGTGSSGYAANMTLTNIEYLIGSGYADTLQGSSANDVFDGGAGADSIDGRDGIDTVSYSSATSSVNVNLLTGVTLGGTAEGDILLNIEAVQGSGYNDTLGAADSGSTLIGGGGNDLYIAGAGADSIVASYGLDTVDYSRSTAGVSVNLSTSSGSGGYAEGDKLSGIEAVIGSSYDDTLAGVSRSTLSGGAGNDLLVHAANGAMKLEGGDGLDTADFSGMNAVTVNLSSGTASVTGTNNSKYNDTLSSIEAVIGTAGNDSITGSIGSNTINAGAGNDVITTNGGNDIVNAGDGNDYVFASAGDILDGGAGSDTLSYANLTSGVNVELGSGHVRDFEFILGSVYNDTIIGSASNEYFFGSLGADSLNGGAAGTDTLDYSSSTGGVTLNLITGVGSGGHAEGDTISGFESISGSYYNDLFISSANAENVNGLGGNDTVDYRASTAAVNVNFVTRTFQGGYAEGDVLTNIRAILGSSHNDTLTGIAGSTLSGGAGDDLLVHAANGAMKLDGGEGLDTVDFSAMNSVNVNLITGTATVQGATTVKYTDTISSVEVVIGTSGNDVVTGSAGNDVISTGAGNDYIVATGGDSIDGGDGNDTVDFRTSTSGVNVDIGSEQVRNFEVVYGSSYNDTIIGTASNEQFYGSLGADSLDGNLGSDSLYYTSSNAGVTLDFITGTGSGGHAEGDTVSGFEYVVGSYYNDKFVSSANAETIDGSSGIDTVDYSASTEAVNVNLSAAKGVGGYAQDDTLYNIEVLIGSNYNDTLTAGSRSLGTVNTTVSGGAGDDLLSQNNEGTVLFDGGIGTDTVDFSPMRSVNINLVTGRATVQGASTVQYTDTLSSIEAVIGTSGNDIVTGSAGNDTISTGAGNDYVYATVGDMLDGGDGNDTVDFSASTSGVNVDFGGSLVQRFEAVYGSSYNDTIIGSIANEYVYGSLGADSLDGGSGGSDTLSYLASNAGVTLNLITGVGTGGHAEGDTISGFDSIIGSYYNDLFISSASAERLNGAGGNDTIDYSLSTAAVNVNLVTNAARGGYAEGDTLYSILAVIGSDYNDTLTGGISPTLMGGAGNDLLIPTRLGASVLNGGEGQDTVDFSAINRVDVNLETGTASLFGTTTVSYTATLSSIEGVIGTSGNDIVTGSAGNDTISTGAGNDYVYATVGDMLDGGAGNDIVNFSSATSGVYVDLGGQLVQNFETVYGSNYNDTIIGSIANEYVYGSLGADSLDGGTGGSDTLSYLASNAGVTLNLITGVGTGGHAEGDTISSFKSIIGSNYNDLFINSANAETIYGGAGIDTVDYSASSAAVSLALSSYGFAIGQGGYAQGDYLSGIEVVRGSNYNDTLSGSFYVTLSGGAGDDLFLQTDIGTVMFDGGEGQDTVSFAAMRSVNVDLGAGTAIVLGTTNTVKYTDTFSSIEGVIGTSGYDTITGSSGNDFIDAGAGNDAIFGSGGNDVINAGDGNDEVVGGSGSDTINGGAGNDYINGLGGYDVINAGDGNDTVLASAGDIVDGGTGTDTLTFNSSASGVNVDLGSDQARNFEVVIGSTHNDTIIGSTLSERIWASLGADLMDGGAGGLDTLEYSASNAAVNVNLSTGIGSGGNAEGDTVSGFEYITGSRFNDRFVSSANAETIDGAAGIDTIDYSASTEAVNVNLTTLVGLGGFAEGDRIYNTEVLIGSNFNDTLAGSGTVTLSGGAGDDLVVRMTGIGMNLSGDEGFDTLDYSSSSTRVNVNLASGTAFYFNGAGTNYYTDTISSFEAVKGSTTRDMLTGSDNDELFDGGSGDDTINGGAGNDTLFGGVGYDQLTGGSGQDVFAFAGLSQGLDTISDFSITDDVLAIQTKEGSISVGFISSSSLGTGCFVDNNVLIYEDASNTYVYADMNGDGNYGSSTDMVVTLTGVHGVTADDIVFYSGS